MSLGLEFLVGADVLKTAVAPTWQDIGQLAAIIAIRTVVNFLLMWELEKVEKSESLERDLRPETGEEKENT